MSDREMSDREESASMQECSNVDPPLTSCGGCEEHDDPGITICEDTNNYCYNLEKEEI